MNQNKHQGMPDLQVIVSNMDRDRLGGSVLNFRCPFVAHVFEPVRSAVFAVQPSFAVGEAAFGATLTFGRVGTIEKGNVLVANVFEPAMC
jgi:hypothetical protein